MRTMLHVNSALNRRDDVIGSQSERFCSFRKKHLTIRGPSHTGDPVNHQLRKGADSNKFRRSVS